MLIGEDSKKLNRKWKMSPEKDLNSSPISDDPEKLNVKWKISLGEDLNSSPVGENPKKIKGELSSGNRLNSSREMKWKSNQIKEGRDKP